jgi:hypothetical protein
METGWNVRSGTQHSTSWLVMLARVPLHVSAPADTNRKGIDPVKTPRESESGFADLENITGRSIRIQSLSDEQRATIELAYHSG